IKRNRHLHRIDFVKRGVAWTYPSPDAFLRGSSQIRAALRCFSSRTRNEKPHRNAKYAYLCATRSEAGWLRLAARYSRRGISRTSGQEKTYCVKPERRIGSGHPPFSAGT